MIINVQESGFYSPRGQPDESLEITRGLFDDRGGKIVVEIGSGTYGGNSVSYWARTDATHIYAIDLDPKRIEEVKVEKRKNNNIIPLLYDGMKFLIEYNKEPIDLLYLDFWTSEPKDSLIGYGRAGAYQRCYQHARGKLAKKSMILIDDTDHIHPWKHTYIIPEARKDGFVVRHTGRQALLVRN